MSPACLKVSRGVTSGFEHFCFPAPHSASLLPVAHSVRVALSLWDPGTRVPFLHSLRHRARGGPWSAPAAPSPKPSSACSDLSAWATGTRRLPGPHGTQDAGPTGASGGSLPSPRRALRFHVFSTDVVWAGEVGAAPASSCLCTRGDAAPCSGHRGDRPLHTPWLPLPHGGATVTRHGSLAGPGCGWADVLPPTPRGRLPWPPQRLRGSPAPEPSRCGRGAACLVQGPRPGAKRLPRPRFQAWTPVSRDPSPGARGSEDRVARAVPCSAVRPASELLPPSAAEVAAGSLRPPLQRSPGAAGRPRSVARGSARAGLKEGPSPRSSRQAAAGAVAQQARAQVRPRCRHGNSVAQGLALRDPGTCPLLHPCPSAPPGPHGPPARRAGGARGPCQTPAWGLRVRSELPCSGGRQSPAPAQPPCVRSARAQSS